jgi:hypothetical protein
VNRLRKKKLMSEVENTELKDAGANGRVVPAHSTSVDTTSAWDRTAQFKKMRSPATPSYYDDIFAFQLPNTKGTRKTHYSFIHHYVDSDGSAGAASVRALANSIAVLNGGRQGTVLRGAARQGVYRHIAAHYKDADREVPELKSDEDVDAIMMFKGLISGPIAESLDLNVKGLSDLDNIIDSDSQVSWLEGEQEIKGIVVEADDDVALVEQLSESGERMGEFYELEYAEMKLRTFVITEKADEMLEKGVIVSWETSKGKYYGDVLEVVTDGMARGEPQGLEIEGSEDKPAYVIRVWMMEEADPDEPEDEEELPEDYDGADVAGKSAGEWTPTNVTVVARGDGLTVEEALPTGAQEDDYDSEDENEETAMKKIDEEFRLQVEQLIKANAEIIERLAKFDVEEKSVDQTETVSVEEVVIEEASAEEVKSEMAVDTTEEVVVEEIVEEAKTEDVIVEEVKAEEQSTEVVEEVQPVQESKVSISFDDLKEFHNLLKDLSN